VPAKGLLAMMRERSPVAATRAIGSSGLATCLKLFSCGNLFGHPLLRLVLEADLLAPMGLAALLLVMFIGHIRYVGNQSGKCLRIGPFRSESSYGHGKDCMNFRQAVCRMRFSACSTSRRVGWYWFNSPPGPVEGGNNLAGR